MGRDLVNVGDLEQRAGHRQHGAFVVVVAQVIKNCLSGHFLRHADLHGGEVLVNADAGHPADLGPVHAGGVPRCDAGPERKHRARGGRCRRAVLAARHREEQRRA